MPRNARIVVLVALTLLVGACSTTSAPQSNTRELSIAALGLPHAAGADAVIVIPPGGRIVASCTTAVTIRVNDIQGVTIACDPDVVAPTPETATVPPATVVPATVAPSAIPPTSPPPTAAPSAIPPTFIPGADIRPYTADGPWNKPIAANPVIAANSAAYISSLLGAGSFGSDPTQYTMPVYIVTASTPLRTVKMSGTYSNVTAPGVMTRSSGQTLQIPLPAGAHPSAGGDSQIVIWNQQTGDEWGFISASVTTTGLSVGNGYHYNTNWSGQAPPGFGSRGAGITYLGGLIRPWEIAQGRIDHAIAFASPDASSKYVLPATKSDGGGSGAPEGTRFQLNPALTDAQITAWGCKNACLTIAHALQTYGMLLIDKSGHPKIYAEYEDTAHWNGVIAPNTVSNIPLSQFRAIAP